MILVVYIFLQGWRATLIPLMAVPVSLIGTFILFPLLGFSINTLSLFGLVLAIGLVVDDAIIVVEAVEHLIEQGMTPRDATIQAMEQVGGPVVAIALILAAVFIPTAAVPGITGRLYQQFAITIAVSVLISAFNALTLSPALAALLLKPKDQTRRRGPLARFFDSVQPHLRIHPGQVRLHCPNVLIHKSAFTMLALVGHCGAGRVHGRTHARPASSRRKTRAISSSPCSCRMLPRCSEPMTPRSASARALLKTPGIEGVVAVDGFSLLTQTQSTNTAFFFVSLKPWEAAQVAGGADRGHSGQRAAGTCRACRDGLAFSFPPPAIPGIGTSGGVTMILQDRSGNDDPSFLTKNLFAYLGALSKRPEIAAAIPSYLPAVPQLYADVDREKAFAAAGGSEQYLHHHADLHGRLPGELLQPLRPPVADLCGSRRRYAHQHPEHRPVLCAQRQRQPGAARFAGARPARSPGPEFILRFNEYNAAQLNITGAPGYSSGQVRAALEEVFHQTMPAAHGLFVSGHELSRSSAPRRAFRRGWSSDFRCCSSF